jgi:hypothetical protein
MKTLFLHFRQSGSVLVTTLVLAMLVGVVVGALLIISQQHNTLTARSQTWSGEIPIAEAGIEEALAHLNSKPKTLVADGWTNFGSNVVKSRVLGDGYYYTTLSTQVFRPTIVSVGFGRVPLQTNFTRRVVTVTAQRGIVWGFVGINGVDMAGTTAYLDSYDSSDPRYSTNGLYTNTMRRDSVGIATLSSATPAIDTRSAKIYGYAATGPGGTVSGNVGDGTFLSTSSGLQSGHVTDDFNMAIDDVILPGPLKTAPAPPAGLLTPLLGGYDYVLGTGDYRMVSLLGLGTDLTLGTMLVTGKARLYIPGDFTVKSGGSLVITNGGSIEIYLGGNSSMGGGGVVNLTGVATNCTIWGLPSCTLIKYTGSAYMSAKIYAPKADVEIGGTAEFCGSIVGLTLKFNGTPALHYDEAIGAAPAYKVTTWEEL